MPIHTSRWWSSSFPAKKIEDSGLNTYYGLGMLYLTTDTALISLPPPLVASAIVGRSNRAFYF
eukprot:scaffold166476_cov31-Tisochrysis_lutea.AAC.2